MQIVTFLIGLVLLFSSLGFETSIPDVANRIKAAYTPAASWRFFRAVLAAVLIATAGVASITTPLTRAPVMASYGAGDAKSVYAAVKAFQKAHGLTADGVVGSKTCPLLYKRCPVN